MARRIRSSAPVAGGVRQQLDQTSSLTSVVEGLVDFAGAAAPVVTKELNKKIEADKVIQMERAYRGEGPSDDATNAGYAASYLVSTKTEGLRLSKDLQNDPKLGTYTDEEFEELISTRLSQSQELLSSEQYPALKRNEELEKALALQTMEIMPAISDARMSAQLQLENKKRNEDLYALGYEAVNGKNPKNVPASLEQLMQTSKVLQMSEVEREGLLLELAKNTNNEGVFEFARTYKGESDKPLLSRSGAMQQLQRKTNRKLTHEKELALWDSKNLALSEFSAGGLTLEEFKQRSLQLDEKYGKAFSEAEYNAAIKSREAAQVKEDTYDKWNEDFSNEKFVDFLKPDGKKAKPNEVAAYLDYERAKTFDAHKDAILAVDNTEGRANGSYYRAVDRAWMDTINTTDELAKQSGQVSPEFKGRLNNIANFDVASNVSKVKGEDGVERFTMQGVSRVGGGLSYEGVADDFNLLQRMPASRLAAYADGNELAILSKTKQYLEGGSSPAEAITQAQYDVRRGKIRITKDSKAVIEELLVSPDSGLFYNDAIPESAQAMMTTSLLNSTIDFDDPNYKKEVGMDMLRQNFTYLSDGSPIKGNANNLKAAMVEELVQNGVAENPNIDLDDWFGTAREMLLPLAKAHFRDADLENEDLQFDVREGMVSIVSGNKVLPRRFSLATLGTTIYKYKKQTGFKGTAKAPRFGGTISQFESVQ